jgi:hypothetical protein
MFNKNFRDGGFFRDGRKQEAKVLFFTPNKYADVQQLLTLACQNTMQPVLYNKRLSRVTVL